MLHNFLESAINNNNPSRGNFTGGADGGNGNSNNSKFKV